MRPALVRPFLGCVAGVVLALTSSALAWTELGDDWLDAIYVPTPHRVVQRMLELAKVGPDDVLYDLGSGDGRIPIAAVRKFKARKAVGVELDPQRIKESNHGKSLAGVGNRVNFLQQDIFKTDFSEATVVSLYLLNRLNVKLRPILLTMRPGTRIVTQTFTMSEWEADYTEAVSFDEAATRGSRNIFLYIVPARVEGRWTLTDGARRISLDIEQRFQHFTGIAVIDDRSQTISGGRLNGASIAFSVEIGGKPVRYEGRVDGNTISGANWSARKQL